ncbi:MAG: IS1634 family transposase [Methanogenium sp.]|nr:IS1634 family transposase [Methanogenium sp.]
MALNPNLFPQSYNNSDKESIVEMALTKETPIENSVTNLAHHGIVAAAYDELGIGGIIDSLIPKTKNHTISHGEMVKAIVINGLGFFQHRLYLFSDFFKEIPIDRLLGKDIDTSCLNDSSIGRTLDAIYEFGPTELYSHIVAENLIDTEYGQRCVHVDTTNFSVYGDYPDSGEGTIDITYGHAKDKRTDLKRFTYGLAVENKGIPLYFEAFSGNASDKKTILDIVEKLTKNLKSKEKTYYIGDSAFYTTNAIEKLGTRTLWITRVPNGIDEAKKLLNFEFQWTEMEDKRYSYAMNSSEYAGIKQVWTVIKSSEMKKRQEDTFKRNLPKKLETARKSLKKLGVREFACKEDAIKAFESWNKKQGYFRAVELEFEEISKRKDGKRGRPKKGEELVTRYKIKAKLEEDKEKIEFKKEQFGKFIIASNDPELNAEQLLSNYKGQSNVERGFRFLKDPCFRLDEVYFKKTSRVQSLAVIMTICLFIYSMVEDKIRRLLVDSGKTVLYPNNQPMKRPTLKRIFQLFMRPKESKIERDGLVVSVVHNLDEFMLMLLDLLGDNYKKYYFSEG